ncbi:uncharacterized protein LOC109714233 [Ananas comosus]|uniref:Uncharacterized protein LOC109714233 n=1 Tax=Ananas comosus TaxID=4615 RepID=A0A6P5FFI5_ANACO|nr:uncharacterized protein LOC109714233 [Ananas comosus]
MARSQETWDGMLPGPPSRSNGGCVDSSHGGLLAYGAGSSVVVADPRSMQLVSVLPMPAPSSSSSSSSSSSLGLLFSKSGSRSSKKTCAICLSSMKSGHGHALFTAECSHTFHFNCISSNVKHGNTICPVCRAKWKELPFHAALPTDPNPGRARINPLNWPQEDGGQMAVIRRLPRVDSSNRPPPRFPLFHPSEPSIFNDDEPLHHLQPETDSGPSSGDSKNVEIKTYSEFPAVQESSSLEDFAVLIHLKAPHASEEASHSPTVETSRAPIDLVTVLDVSGSMAGTKLALLKRAMGFVIQNLGPSDRLSVIAFSSAARRLFHLRRMSDSGRHQALQAVNSLVAGGGTNIAEGLRKSVKVIEERGQKNPVCSIVLLSDGQDTYTISSNGSADRPNYHSLVPPSISLGQSPQIPVHTFGFGMDHDSAAMHFIAEASGGTFSFIEAEGVIQDAFAQCIGGLLSVVVQEMEVSIECVHSGVVLSSIKSGSYTSQVAADGQFGTIKVGDLYADEERDFLLTVNIPPARGETILLEVCCSYKDPLTKETVESEVEQVTIERPKSVSSQIMSIEVDRERNRIQVAEAMSAARAAAERGALNDAVAILQEQRRVLSESLAGRSADRFCLGLDAELREMGERMASRRRYEESGRAYMLSGLSSHLWQRATARGDSTDSGSLVHSYQTPLMADMLQRSQTLVPSPRSGPAAPAIRPVRSFSSHSQPW